jgi:hypothetical protein
MCDNRYKSLVEVDILLHSVLVVGSCDIPLVLYLFQSLLLLALHLCSQLDPLAACYTEAPSYTVRYCSGAVLRCTMDVLCYMAAAHYYTVVAHYYTAVAHYYNVAAHYYTAIAQCCMGLVLG